MASWPCTNPSHHIPLEIRTSTSSFTSQTWLQRTDENNLVFERLITLGLDILQTLLYDMKINTTENVKRPSDLHYKMFSSDPSNMNAEICCLMFYICLVNHSNNLTMTNAKTHSSQINQPARNTAALYNRLNATWSNDFETRENIIVTCFTVYLQEHSKASHVMLFIPWAAPVALWTH